jgi:hypothetical protein
MAKTKPALLSPQVDKPINLPADPGKQMRDLATMIAETLPRFAVPPLLQEQNEQLKKLSESLRLPAWPESLRLPGWPLAPEPDSILGPKPPKKRRNGGGRPSTFTKEEVAKVQPEYKKLLSNEPGIDDDTAVIRLRTLVPREKRGYEHIRSWQRHIFEPVRKEMPADIIKARREAQRQKIKAPR